MIVGKRYLANSTENPLDKEEEKNNHNIMLLILLIASIIIGFMILILIGYYLYKKHWKNKKHFPLT